MTFTVLTGEYMAECRRREAAGDAVPVILVPLLADPGEDPGWFAVGPASYAPEGRQVTETASGGPLRGAVSVGNWPQSRQLTVSKRTAALMEGGQPVGGVVAVREWPADVTAGPWRPLPFVTRIVIPGAAPDDLLTADITTWVGEDGEPVTEGAEPAVEDGKPVTATFSYLLDFSSPQSW